MNNFPKFGEGVTISCRCCGAHDFEHSRVLWDELCAEWKISPEERDYIDRQQGTRCRKCGNTLRSIALATGILDAIGRRGTFRRFVRSPVGWLFNVCEINEAGTLTRDLRRLPRRTLAKYPEVDMLRMPYSDDRFDLVVHSDTLEHVPDPIRALSECRRVLKPGGHCCFTIPIIVGRLTRSRESLPPSFHGAQADRKPDFLVQTEYGGDFWTHVFAAGFRECRIVTAEFPSAQAVIATK